MTDEPSRQAPPQGALSDEALDAASGGNRWWDPVLGHLTANAPAAPPPEPPADLATVVRNSPAFLDWVASRTRR